MKPRMLINFGLQNSHLTELQNNTEINIDLRSMSQGGSTDYADILSEYDIIVLNTSEVNHCDFNSQRSKQIKNFVESRRGILIVLLNKFTFNNWQTNYFSIYHLIREQIKNPLEIFDQNDTGSEFELTPAGKVCPFVDYLIKKPNTWTTSIDKKYVDNLISLAFNADGNIVAFSLKGYEQTTFFIPWNSNNENLLWELISNLTRDLIVEDVTEGWVKEYTVPTLEDVEKNILKLNSDIDKIEKEKQEHEKKRNALLNIKDTLLFRDGLHLQSVVGEVLKQIGFDIRSGASGREDLVVVENKNHYVIEVKGLTKSAAEKNVNQLYSKKSQYEIENKVSAKGVLIVNAWRKLSLEQRNLSDTLVFPQQMLPISNIWNVALMTTQQIFYIYCKFLLGEFSKEEFLTKLSLTKGVLQGYDRLDEFKLTLQSENDLQPQTIEEK